MTTPLTQFDQVYTSPNQYVQGRDLLDRADRYVSPFGSVPYIICDETVWKIAGEKLFNTLKNADMDVSRAEFGGEASLKEIKRIVADAKEQKSDVIVAVGGGKTIDTGRAVASLCKIPVAVFPTAVSADAPTARASVIYTEDGAFDQYMFYPKNPEIVCVDTRVIAGAPVRTTRSGIGDALATAIEARAVHAAGSNRMDDTCRPTIAGIVLAEACEKVLFEYGEQALADNKAGVPSVALANICEANTLLSGLGFENGGLAAAHAIHNGFTALEGDIHHCTHGEKVSFACVVQLVMQGTPQKELEKYLDFMERLELPTTMADIHLDKATDEDLMKVAEAACSPAETMKQMQGVITPGDVVEAIKAADVAARTFRAQRNK